MITDNEEMISRRHAPANHPAHFRTYTRRIRGEENRVEQDQAQQSKQEVTYICAHGKRGGMVGEGEGIEPDRSRNQANKDNISCFS